MERCAFCGGKRAKRECPALEKRICSVCCGTKRQKEIRCPAGCDILKGSGDYQLEKEVRTEMTDRIGETFRTAADDILDKPGKGRFGLALERSFLDAFYGDKSVNDNDIRAALTKIYAGLTRGTVLEASDAEKRVIEAWEKADSAHPLVSKDLKLKTILRVVKSIRDTSGGLLGNRNYIRMIHEMRSSEWPSEEDPDMEREGEEDAEATEEELFGKEGEDEGDDGAADDEDERDEAQEDEAVRKRFAAQAHEFRAETPGELLGAVMRAVDREDPDELEDAREIFKKESGRLAKDRRLGISGPMMAAEFAVWFCAECPAWESEEDTHIQWFRRMYEEHLDGRTRALARALDRSVQSLFVVEGPAEGGYRLRDCATGHEYRVRAVLERPLETGWAVYTRLVRDTGLDDGSYCILSTVFPMNDEAVAEARRQASSKRELLDGVRKEFIRFFGMCDPIFEHAGLALAAMVKFEKAWNRGRPGAGRSRGRPAADDLFGLLGLTEFDFMREGPAGPVALLFEEDGLRVVEDYPDILGALDGTEKDEARRRELVRDAIEDDGWLPMTTVRRLFEKYRDEVVRILSGIHPQTRTFEDVKRQVERERCEPFNLTPVPRLDPPGQR